MKQSMEMVACMRLSTGIDGSHVEQSLKSMYSFTVAAYKLFFSYFRQLACIKAFTCHKLTLTVTNGVLHGGTTANSHRR